MEPNLYCFLLAARMTNRYFAAVGFAGFAAAHFAGTDRAVAEPEMVVAGYMAAGQAAEIAIELAVVDKAVGPVDHLAADHIEVADTPAEEAVNHQSALRCFHEKPRPYQTYSYLAVQL